MSYFDDAKNVEDYIKMAEGYDGRDLIEVLKTYLESGSTVLELGMGPGTDFEILREAYQVTGSDSSFVFVERYRERDASADLVLLDAVTMDIDRRFDGIYSNKVLHHLTRDDLRASFVRQAEVLNDDGILCHAFWYGKSEETHHDLRFTYYTEATLADVIGDGYEMLASKRYTEMEEEDSLLVILKKRSYTQWHQ